FQVKVRPEQILFHPPEVLSQEQRQDYFDLGYVKVEELIPKNTLVELRRVIDKVLDASREETQSRTVFDLGPEHNPQKPVLRRLKNWMNTIRFSGILRQV
ncbi:MAG: hypothetical protein VX063_06090, partial [SAR324 cluster bacterium]|nr:hypothetical protein [SAR324 cluster bacterium]